MKRWIGIALLGAAALARAQAPDYHQTGESPHNPNDRLTIDRLGPPYRIPVRTSAAQPLTTVEVKGWRDMYCASRGSFREGSSWAAGGQLNFPEALYGRLSALDLGAMQAALQNAHRAAGRAEAYRELFGVELSPLSGYGNSRVVEIGSSGQMQLNIGQEVVVTFAHAENRDTVCATPADVDAAIATAKQVYAAVILAKQGKPSSGLKDSTPEASGLQAK